MDLSVMNFAGMFVLCLIILPDAAYLAQKLETLDFKFGPFRNNETLQRNPDAGGNFTIMQNSGQLFFTQLFTLWEGQGGTARVASFDTSFLVSLAAEDGLAFLIAPDIYLPSNASGQILGSADVGGNSSNSIVAIEFDNFEWNSTNNSTSDDVNGCCSNQTTTLSGIHFVRDGSESYRVWINYDGRSKDLKAFIVEEGKPKPQKPVLLVPNLNLKTLVHQKSYFGFAAPRGIDYQFNNVFGWNLTVEKLQSSINDNNDGKQSKVIYKIYIGVGVSVMVLVIVVTMLMYYLRKKAAASNPNILGALTTLPGMPREFRFRDLKKATDNFDDKNKLGQGGFGVVYRGILPNEDVQVAVKKFSRNNLKGQGDFLSELNIINRLRHKHLVRLLGWCNKNCVLLLVYDYMPNGSLDKHIFNSQEEKATLEWELRYNIIAGIASALHYLHNESDQKVVHRDLKASNIMLDANFNARLGDFGLARVLENENTSYTELEGVAGTMGYIAPECLHTGKATRKSDIYGFGAVVLEVVCGQRPWTRIAGFRFLVDWVWWLHREGRILEAVDERLGMDYNAEQAERLLLLGLACSHPIAIERPKTEAIVQIVSGLMAVPNVPPFKPNFVWPSRAEEVGPAPNRNIDLDVATDITLITSGR